MATHSVEIRRFPRIWNSALATCLAVAAGCSGPPNDEPPSSCSEALGAADYSRRASREGGSYRSRHSEDEPCGYAGASGAAGTAGAQAGASGGANAGQGGSNGGVGASGGQAGSGGASAGQSGNDGGVGASGGQAGSGGANAGQSGNGGTPGSAVVSPSFLDFSGQCNVPAQSLTISNTGDSPLTWVANVSGVPVRVFPFPSTVLPGTSVALTVSPFSPLISTTASGTITIDTDVAGQLGPIGVSYNVSGITVTPPPNIDFGTVLIGSQKKISFQAPPGLPGAALGSSNSDFLLTGVAPANPSPGFWTLIFTPRVTGPQSTTLTLGSFIKTVCPPNTFTATGIGVAP